jgi:alpha-tubulin suppressor-like RCC1 family protein
LLSTCRFFSNYLKLEEIRDSKSAFEIASGIYHTLLLKNGQLFVSGSNRWSQLGYSGDETSIYGFKRCLVSLLAKDENIVKIAAGRKNTLLLSNQGKLIVSGCNNLGELGFDWSTCFEYREEGQYKAYVDGFKTNILSILEKGESLCHMEAGDVHTLLFTNKGRILVSGSNHLGELGLSEDDDFSHYEFKVCAIAVLKVGEYITQVVAGNSKSLLLTNQNRLLVSGSNNGSQLGFPKDKNEIYSFQESIIQGLESDEWCTQMVSGNVETLLLSNKGSLFASLGEGYFERCPIGALDEGETICQVATGENHSLLLTNKRRLLVSGENNYGQLGVSKETKSTRPFIVCTIDVLNKGEFISRIVARGNHSLLLTSKGRLLGSGDNSHGQLAMSADKKQVFGFEECNIKALKKPMADASSVCNYSL